MWRSHWYFNPAPTLASTSLVKAKKFNLHTLKNNICNSSIRNFTENISKTTFSGFCKTKFVLYVLEDKLSIFNMNIVSV